MKKHLLQITFAVLGLLTITPMSFSQEILNENFSEFDQDIQGFDNWQGTASIYTDLVPDSGNAAKVSSYVLVQNIRTCASWVTGKDGKRTCSMYQNVPFASSRNNSISQTIDNINTIPAVFSADIALLNSDEQSGGKISIEGYYNGFSINTIFDVTTTSLVNQRMSIPINVTTSNCIECPQNYLSIKIESMAKNDPTIDGNTPMPSIIIDNLKFEGVNNMITGLAKNELNNLSIYPNPATSVINSVEYVEILDLMGNQVAEGNGEIQVSHLNKGLYLVKSEKGSTKIVIE